MHYITIPPPPPSFPHSCSPSLSASLLPVPSLIMSRSVRPAHAAPTFTSERILLAPRPPGRAHTPKEKHQRWASPRLLNGSFCMTWLLCRAGPPGPAGPRWAGTTEHGHRPSLGSTDPRYQLPSSSYFCMLPFPLLRSLPLLSCLFLEPADIYLLIQANALRIRKVRMIFFFLLVFVF